jgi:hypothetical protein
MTGGVNRPPPGRQVALGHFLGHDDLLRLDELACFWVVFGLVRERPPASVMVGPVASLLSCRRQRCATAQSGRDGLVPPGHDRDLDAA